MTADVKQRGLGCRVEERGSAYPAHVTNDSKIMMSQSADECLGIGKDESAMVYFVKSEISR